MKTQREAADSYMLRSKDGHDWARVFIQSGLRSDTDRPSWWLYISAISTYGTYGHCFMHCAEPPAPFLRGASFDYAMGKLAAGGHREFSTDAYLRALRSWCCMNRRDGSIGKAEARELWVAVKEASEERSRDAVLTVISESSELFWSRSLSEISGDVESSQARSFYDMVWPQLTAALYESSLVKTEAAEKIAT